MSMNDPIADFLTRIRNGQAARKKSIRCPSSTAKEAIARVLEDEGYIQGFDVADEPGNKKLMTVALNYFEGKPVIERIERVSKPSLREYRGSKDIPQVIGGLGIAIVSTSKGVVSDRQARASGHGGEVLCIVQ